MLNMLVAFYSNLKARLAEYTVYLVDKLKKVETLVAIINIIVVMIIVPYQGNETRNSQFIVSEYRDIRHNLVLLRTNDEQTYDACKKQKSGLIAVTAFEKEMNALQIDRLERVRNLTASAVEVDRSFGDGVRKEIDHFILWNNRLNWSKGNICDQDLKSGPELFSWQEKLLAKMRSYL